ncbi:MAG: glycerophosphodiester phosphodiesterase [Patescibacteria group bacterium]
MEKPFIIAHRIVNETICNKEALKKLLTDLQNKNVWGAEFDIRQTKDSEFIAFHDAKFSQLKRNIKDYTLEELKKEATKNNFSFLTVEEVLKIVPPSFLIQIDIKDKKISIEPLIKVLRQSQLLNQIIVSSFYPHIILQLSGCEEIKHRWLLVNISTKRNLFHIFYAVMPIRFALKCKATGIAPQQYLVSKNLLLKAHKTGLTVATWTIDNLEEIKRLEKYGLDYIIADCHYI